MPENKSRLSLSIAHEQRKRELTDREAATEMGVLQQTYSTWKSGRIPREKVWSKLAAFLQISTEQLEALVKEAEEGAETGKLPALAAYAHARVYGRMADRKEGKIKFDTSRKFIPEGRYAIVIDTKIMEPVLRVGSKAWVDPGIWPKPGHDVIAHARGFGWIGRLEQLVDGHAQLSRYGADPVEIKDVDAVHVIVLSERI